MYSENYHIRIETLENGFTVEVPDFEKIAEKKKADAKKKGEDYPSYLGECTEKRVAKSAQEVVDIVKAALKGIPEREYDEAFDAASAAES
jgi:hypothetical protein